MRAVVLGLAVTVLLVCSARAATFHGVMTNGGGAVRSGEQGALWRSRRWSLPRRRSTSGAAGPATATSR